MKNLRPIAIIVAACALLSAAACAPAEADTTTAGAAAAQLSPAPSPAESSTTTGLNSTPDVVVSNNYDMTAPATEMSLAKLQAEFAADPGATVARYSGQRFIFRGVTAERVSSIYKPMDGDQFVINGDFKFRPLYLSYLAPLKINSVMDIEGTVDYEQWNYLVFSGCAYTVTDTTNAIERPDYIFTF